MAPCPAAFTSHPLTWFFFHLPKPIGSQPPQIQPNDGEIIKKKKNLSIYRERKLKVPETLHYPILKLEMNENSKCKHHSFNHLWIIVLSLWQAQAKPQLKQYCNLNWEELLKEGGMSRVNFTEACWVIFRWETKATFLKAASYKECCPTACYLVSSIFKINVGSLDETKFKTFLFCRTAETTLTYFMNLQEGNKENTISNICLAHNNTFQKGFPLNRVWETLF